MKIKRIASNVIELQYKEGLILFIDDVPVAFQQRYNVSAGSGLYRTKVKECSSATMRHVNKWRGGVYDEILPQTYFDNLI